MSDFYCGKCGNSVSLDMRTCPNCGATLNVDAFIRKKASIAMLASFFVPGFGQMYIGEHIRGLKILVVAVSVALLPALLNLNDLYYLLYLCVMVFATYDAIFTTRRHYLGAYGSKSKGGVKNG